MTQETKASVIKKLQRLAGFEDLNPNQVKLKLADMKKSTVLNALKKAGLKGGAIGIGLSLLTLPISAALKQPQGSVPKKGPMRLAGRAAEKKETDKQKIKRLENELAVEKTLGKVVTESSKKKPLRPKVRPKNLKKSLAPSVSKRPQTRKNK